jgi:hypothetical protein
VGRLAHVLVIKEMRNAQVALALHLVEFNDADLREFADEVIDSAGSDLGTVAGENFHHDAGRVVTPAPHVLGETQQADEQQTGRNGTLRQLLVGE